MREPLITWGLILGIALAVALGLYLAGGCALAKKYRPPLILQSGPIYLPSNEHDQEHTQLFGRISVATRPVGGWVDLRYGVGSQNVESMSAGFTIFLSGGEYWQPQTNQEILEEESLLPSDATR